MSKAKMENRALPKRFYRQVSLQQNERGWRLLLDGKTLRTPAKQALCIAHKPLAEAIAAEWEAQLEFVQPGTMPLMRLASLTIDRAPFDRAQWIDDMLRYGETDLVCYRLPSGDALGDAQRATFDPILAWLREAHGVALDVTDAILPIEQQPSALHRLQSLLMEASDAEITALAMLVPLLGSLVLALALWRNHLTIEQTLHAARLDETHHAAQWGEDAEAAAAWESKATDIRACDYYLTHSALK